MNSILGLFTLDFLSNTRFLPYQGNTWSMQITRLSDVPEYFDEWALGSEDNQVSFVIDSFFAFIEKRVKSFALKSSLALCLADELSFYFDLGNQIVYAHFPGGFAPDSSNVYFGRLAGYTNTETKYTPETDIRLDPYLRSVPNIVKKADPIELSKMAFPTQRVSHINGVGEMDRFIDSPIQGTNYRLAFFDDLEITPIYEGYIEKDKYTRQAVEYQLKDIRSKENISIPVNVFSSDIYEDLEEEYRGEVISDGYGRMTIQAYPVDGLKTIGTSEYTFRCLEIYTELYLVEAKQDDDSWQTVSVVSETPYNGSFVLSSSDCKDSNGSLREIRVDVMARDFENPADFITDLNDRHLNIAFDADNYDVNTWNTEKAKILGKSFLYMNSRKKMYFYVEQLQGAGVNNFFYDINNLGKRVLFVDDKDRASSFVIPNYEIISHSAERDFTFYASTVRIFHSPDYLLKTWKSEDNDDFEEERLFNYKNPQSYDSPKKNAALSDSLDAISRALVIAEKYEPRFIHSVTFNIFSKEAFDFHIFQTGVLELADTDIEQYEGLDGIEFRYDALDGTEFAIDAEDGYLFAYPCPCIDPDYRAYFGTRQIEIYQIKPNLESMTMTIVGREL